MMGAESRSVLAETREEMEILKLDGDDSFQGMPFGDYRSAMTSISESCHPLSYSSAVSDGFSDPLCSSASGPNFSRNPSVSSDHGFLDPPSYADAIFTPFDETSQNGGSDRHEVSGEVVEIGSESSCSASEYLKICVSNPQKEQQLSSNSLVPGSNTFVTYLIETRTNIPEFGATEFSVRRRFRDIVTLADRLSEVFRGFFIPPRPDKNVVESQVMQKQEFVEQRRVALEKYLRRLAVHPVIRKSDELKVFLQVQGKLPLLPTTDVASRMLDGAVKLPRQLFGEQGSAIPPHEVLQPAKGGRDLLRIFKELKQSVVNDWSGAKPLVVEEDKDFMEKKEKIQNLEQQLSTSSRQAEALVKAQQDMGETLGELGLAFIKLTKFETEEATCNSQRIRATETRSLGTAAVKASRFHRESNAQTVKNLDTLHEYLGLMLAVHNAFSDRSSALLTVQTLSSELTTLHLKAEKLETASSKIFGGDKSRVQKIEELKETIRLTEDAKICALKEYERIKENNRNELERLERERHNDFLSMLKGFVINQVGYAEKIANVWAKVAEDLNSYVKESS